MTRKTRIILFLICLILFLLITPTVVFYSQGYRIDFESKKIVRTGAFYFKVLPKSVEVYINGKLKKKTGFLFGTVLIENLLPKKYSVEIKKEGFWPWKKTLEVKEKGVCEAKNIVLVPQNPKFLVLNKDIAPDFFFSPDEKKLILKKTTAKGWQLSLFDLKKNTQDLLIEKNEEFLNLKWSSGSKKVLLETKVNEKKRYYILELEKIPADVVYLEFLGENIQDIFFNPKHPQKIFFTKSFAKAKNESFSNILFGANYVTKRITGPISDNLLTFEVSEGNIFGISTEGSFLKINPDLPDLKGQEKLNLEPFPLEKGVEYQLSVRAPRFLLKEGEIFYLFDQDLKRFQKVFEGIKDFKFSPDSQKIAYFNNNEIWILFLEEKFDQPQKTAGERIFLTRFSEKIDNVFWYTSHYLVFNTGNKIKIAEIDDRDRINIVDLAEFKEPKIFWSQNDKKLYILSNGNLYRSEKLLP